jgi:hypothetical protein
MTDRSTGPRCGNNPNTRLTPGDRKAVDDFKARLALQAAAKPYIERAAWVDFDPLMEVIAATLWEHCGRDSEDMPQLVCDDPRTIAALAAAVARAHAASPAPATDQTALREAIRRAACEAEGFAWDSDMLEPDEYGEVADAVLAVLPASADRAAVRAEAFDEAAEKLAHLDPVKAALAGQHAWKDAAGILRHMAVQERRMAEEEQQPKETRP